MPSDWLRIRQARPDLTDYVLHCTRLQKVDGTRLKPFDVLKLIIQDGFLKPSFAPRSSKTAGTRNDTIKGPYPAVCFTEQPLAAFLQSCRTLSGRYQRYAIAMRKGCLYKYGGRPVIYGDQNLLDELSKDWSDAEEMKQFIQDLPPYSGTNTVLEQYHKELPNAFIIPLDEVERRLAIGKTDWARLDTLPVDDLYPGSSSTFTRIGWSQS